MTIETSQTIPKQEWQYGNPNTVTMILLVRSFLFHDSCNRTLKKIHLSNVWIQVKIRIQVKNFNTSTNNINLCSYTFICLLYPYCHSYFRLARPSSQHHMIFSKISFTCFFYNYILRMEECLRYTIKQCKHNL